MQNQPQIALIADDDEFFRMAISSILSNRLGFSEVIESGSLDEALDCLGEREGISLALFDLAMPGMESPASLGAVRELLPDILVAVVSGSRRRSDVLVALEIGVHGYIPKGLGVDELGNAIRSILEGAIFVPSWLAEVPPHPQNELALVSPEPASSAPPGVLEKLTPRQRDVLGLLIQGQSNKEIARSLGLGEGTVKVYVAALLRSLGVKNRSAAAVMGAQLLGSQ